MPFKVTTAAYFRSHCKQPRGHGTWAFQRTNVATAYEDDLRGPRIFSPPLSYGLAKKWLKQNHPSGLFAVLP